MALYYGNQKVADDADYRGSDNAWIGMNVFSDVRPANTNPAVSSELSSGAFFAVYGGQLRHFDMQALRDALGQQQPDGDLDLVCVNKNAAESVPFFTRYGDFGISSVVGGKTTWSGQWSKQLDLQKIVTKWSNEGDFSITQGNITQAKLKNGDYGYSISPRLFIYSRISAMWKLTADVAIYFSLPGVVSAASQVEKIGDGKLHGRFYRFKGGDKDGWRFPKAVFDAQKATSYYAYGAFASSAGQYGPAPTANDNKRKWYGHPHGNVARIKYGLHAAARFRRPQLGGDWLYADEFMPAAGQPDGDALPCLRKGDEALIWYDVEFIASAPLKGAGGSPTNYCQYGTVRLELSNAVDIAGQYLQYNNAPENVSGLKKLAVSNGFLGQKFSLSMWKAK